MTKKEHFSLMFKSFEVDPDSWVSDRYRVHNKKLNCNIWIANGLIYFVVNRSPWSNAKLYNMNPWEQLKLYFTYLKWKRKNKKSKKYSDIRVDIDDRYKTYLNRHETIDKILENL